MTDSAAELKQLLRAIFEDGIVDPGEREQLTKFTKSMSQGQKSSVFKEFLGEKWGEAMSDDRLTAAEVRLLGHIMEELNLELDHVPEQARFALKDAL